MKKIYKLADWHFIYTNDSGEKVINLNGNLFDLGFGIIVIILFIKVLHFLLNL